MACHIRMPLCIMPISDSPNHSKVSKIYAKCLRVTHSISTSSRRYIVLDELKPKRFSLISIIFKLFSHKALGMVLAIRKLCAKVVCMRIEPCQVPVRPLWCSQRIDWVRVQAAKTAQHYRFFWGLLNVMNYLHALTVERIISEFPVQWSAYL